MDQTDPIGLLSIGQFSCQTDLQSLCETDDARQTLRASRTRHDSVTDFWKSHLGILGRHADIASHGDLEAAADRIAANQCNRGLSDSGNRQGLSVHPWIELYLSP